MFRIAALNHLRRQAVQRKDVTTMATTTNHGVAQVPPGAGAWNLDVLAQNWWALALRGGLAILFGLVALFYPLPTLLSLVIVFAIFALVDGVFAVAGALRAMARREPWGLMLVAGAISIVIGSIALFWPAITMMAFVY